MPLEILIDTKKPGGVMQPATFAKLNQLDKSFSEYSELSPSLPAQLTEILKTGILQRG